MIEDIVEAQKPPVGSVSVLASEEVSPPESDRAVGKMNTTLALGHVGSWDRPGDDDLDEPLPKRTCAVDGEECESCQ